MSVLRTARLLLRPPIEADLDAWCTLLGDEATARFIGGVRSRPMVWRSLATMAGSWSLRGFGMFSVIEQRSGACLGRVGPWFPEGWPGREIGWGLIRAAQGKGYAHEAAIACMERVDAWGQTRAEWNFHRSS